MKLLLHCCCGPCSVSVIRALLLEGLDEGLNCYFNNPNIQPSQEHQARVTAWRGLMDHYKLPAYEEPGYPLEDWLRAVASNHTARCEYCYASRLEATAAQAAQLGCEAFSTTLLISPYQNHQRLRELGEIIAGRYKLSFFYRDWRPHFRPGQAAAREMGLYMQKYCGCIYSEKERYSGLLCSPS
ncbi:MAG: epoxyqueuosine reductase QueH [Clostridiales bacterium]|nr:epoxyqueuosine reductase QueH [Clostridiales bacterium]